MKRIVNFSGGKDSTAMLIKLLEEGTPIDEIIYCDTYKEFPQMYEHIEKVKKYIKEKYNKEITVLKSPITFDYYMFDYIKTRGKNKGQKGYSWAGVRMRWCTSKLKVDIINKYLRKYKGEQLLHYIGIAYDEQERAKDKCYPLINWKMTEEDCLQFCYQRGFDWNGLYEIFDRVSCWCCPLQSLNELRNLRQFFPDLWNELGTMDKKTYRKFRADYSVEDLELKFAKEMIALIKLLKKNSDTNKIIDKINEIIRYINFIKSDCNVENNIVEKEN